MGHSLATWIKDWETISRLAPDGIDLLNGKPRLLGYIPQRFRVYGGQLTTGYARYLSKIEKGINNDIVSRMHKVMPTLAHEISGDLRLGLIKDFGTLANAAQTQGLPMWEVDAGTQLQRDEAKDVFLEIAKKIIAKID
jgi:hypothetical protein